MGDIAESLKRGRNLARGTAILGAAAVLFAWYSFQDHSKLVKAERSQATVEAVKQMGVLVRFASGETVLIAVPGGVPVKEGDSIPVRIETYESGNRIVLFDKERWALDGG